MGVAVVRVGAPSVAGMVGCAGLTRSLPGTLTISPLFSASEDGTGDDGVSRWCGRVWWVVLSVCWFETAGSLPGTWLPSSDEFGKNLVDACDFGGDDGVCLSLR